MCGVTMLDKIRNERIRGNESEENRKESSGRKDEANDMTDDVDTMRQRRLLDYRPMH